MRYDSPDAAAVRTLLEEGRILRIDTPAGTHDLMRDFRIDRGEAEAIAAARAAGIVCATDDGPAIRCCRALGVAFTSAIGLLAALAEARRVEPDLALELSAKLGRFGRHDARISDDVARRIRRAARPGSGGGRATKNVMSVRLDEENLKRLREIARREKKEMSSVPRELIEQGIVFRPLHEFRQGKVSLGTLARRLSVSSAEAIDLLAELGVRSPIEYDDYLKSASVASVLVREKGL